MARKPTEAQQNLFYRVRDYLEGNPNPDKWLSMYYNVILSLKKDEAEQYSGLFDIGGYVQHFKQAYIELDADETTAQELALLLAFRNAEYYNTHEQARAALEKEQEALLSKIFPQGSIYARIAQNPATNALSKIARNGVQLMLDSPDAVATIGDKKKKLDFIFKDATEYGIIKTQDNMLLDALLLVFQQTRRQMVTLAIKDYAELRGRSTTTENLREVRKEVIESLERLRNIGVSYHERVRGKYVFHGGMRLNGGTAIVRNGVIYWNWNTDFMESLSHAAPMDYAKETLLADPRTNVYYFSRFIDLHYRSNEGKPTENTITVRTLVGLARNLPTIDEVKAGRHSPKKRIIEPFFRDLDTIDRLIYSVYDKDGNEVQPEHITDYETFMGCKIVFDVSAAGLPKHDERTKARKRREEKAKKQTKKPR